MGEDSQDWIYEHLWLVPGTSSVTAYVTSVFVHEGFFHLLGNMIYLFLFGCCVEDMIGRARFVLFYFVCGFVAEMVFIGSTPLHFSSLTPMGGASGAISGCMGMYLLLRASAEIEFKYFYFFFIGGAGGGDFSLASWIVITFWFLTDLFWMFIDMHSRHRGGGTAFGAHVGGFLGGLALIGVYRLVAQKKELAEEEAAEAAEVVAEPVAPAPQTARTPAPERKPIRLRTQPAWANPAPAEPAPVAPVETPTIFLHENGQQTGPFTLLAVQDLLRQNSVSSEAFYWSEGMADWKSVTELAG
jgi:membrane associated rhomboid family serine protease